MKLFDVQLPLEDGKYHNKFAVLCTEPAYCIEKDIISDWAINFQDKDGKFVNEFQTTFHSSFWELYLHKAFNEMGFSIDFDPKHYAPDFILNGEDGFNVEAVVSNIKADGEPESSRTYDHHLQNLMEFSSDEEFSSIIDEAIVRHSNSMQSKLKKYIGHSKNGKIKKGYRDLTWVDETKPFVIALASYDQIEYGKESFYSMLALLYGFYFSPEKYGYELKESIKKPYTDSDIKLGIFKDESFSDISAVIFTCNLTLGKLTSLAISQGMPSFKSSILIKLLDENIDGDFIRSMPMEVTPTTPESLFDGLYIFHNPKAKIKLSSEKFSQSKIMEITSDFSSFTFSEGRLPPIRARITELRPLKEIFMREAELQYNRHLYEESIANEERYFQDSMEMEKKRSDEKLAEFYSERFEKKTQKKKTGRNAPCPCNSGIKYKKCCYFLT
ncbi:YecA family protein [Shewanella septentrionalis]|uniref:SEC-C metal-binding domain-containing protein n=1 Tax=Shewanella septentrionalis TaxID=2952223 RepID=A0A9X3AV58_9GAMM|nr:SEC-C metal-binding domain-containing protein [Shewanella septentrionalis]MCT7947177.1 SEC-C metal-binding domain-containing protein [Shewanella septentrionalis]